MPFSSANDSNMQDSSTWSGKILEPQMKILWAYYDEQVTYKIYFSDISYEIHWLFVWTDNIFIMTQLFYYYQFSNVWFSPLSDYGYSWTAS